MKNQKITKSYLTIDDAPSKDFRKKIDFLIKKRIPAIIFCEGRHIEGREKNLIYAIKKGFILGNHSYNHLHFSKIDAAKGFMEIKRTDELIEKLYKDSNIKRPIKIFRFPYGDKGGKSKRKFQKFLKHLGYKNPFFGKLNFPWFMRIILRNDIDIFWTFNLKEYQIGKSKYKYNKIEDILKLMDKKKFRQGCDEIILIHDHDHTTNYFELIINNLLDKNIKFIGIKI